MVAPSAARCTTSHPFLAAALVSYPRQSPRPGRYWPSAEIGTSLSISVHLKLARHGVLLSVIDQFAGSALSKPGTGPSEPSALMIASWTSAGKE